jgi:hypothetical protein
MNEMFAAYTAFNHIKHGGEPNDRPDNRYLYIMPIETIEDVTFAFLWGLHVGWVYRYEWTSPRSHSKYVLCIPKGIVILQRSIRKRFLTKRVKGLFYRQLLGKWPHNEYRKRVVGYL